VAASIDPTELEIYLQTQKQYSRREKYLRAGAGYPNPAFVVQPGIGIAAPVTLAQGSGAVTLIYSIESVGPAGVYPNGNAFDCGDLLISHVAAGTLGIISSGFTVILSPNLSLTSTPGGGFPASGTNTYVIFSDPPNNRMGAFMNGIQITQGTGAIPLWADGVKTWEFANSISNVGFVSDLEIHLGFVPPGFVG